jgi:hypothetical protein
MFHTLLALGIPGGPDIVFIGFIYIIVVIPFWRILKKAGFHPAISLLTLFPPLGIVLLFFLAFAPWPNQKQK